MPKGRAIVERRRSERSNPVKPVVFTATDISLEKRLDTERIVNAELFGLGISMYDACITRGILNESLVGMKYLASGAYGNVYSAKLANTPKFVIKEAFLDKSEKKKLDENTGITVRIVPRTAFPDEYEIMNLVNNALYSEQCPNFVLTYNLGICPACRSPEDNCYIAIMELAFGDMTKVDFDDRIATSALFQLLAALHWLHTRYGIYHGDLSRRNILVMKAPTTGTTTYIINGKDYTVENVGYTFCISDFGLSQVYRPYNALVDYLGTRNAKVVGDRLVPFTSEVGIRFDKYGNKPIPTFVKTITWNDGEISTKNIFSNTLDNKPSIEVDLDDFYTFPAHDFTFDIQAVLNLFAGGMGSNHYTYSILPGISTYFASKLRNYQREKNELYTKDAKYVRADLMLDYLYNNEFIPVTTTLPNTVWEMS